MKAVDLRFDISIFLYALMGTMVYWNTFWYSKKNMLTVTHEMIIEHMQIPVVLFDYEGILADFNSFFEEELTITFDYAYKDYIDGNLNFFGAKELNRELQNIGEPHIFGIDPNDVNSFVNNLNYVIYEHFTANDLENKFLNNSFNIHGFHGILNLVKI